MSNTQPAEVVLQIEHLSKSYGPIRAVKDLSLQVLEGEVLGFLGPNGAGKTTSINMMCGLLKPDAGQVTLRGKNISNGDAQVHRQVGVCPQNIILWERLTCLEQLQFIGEMYGLSASQARKRSLLLLEEMGLPEQRNRQARTLSGGMQRRLNLIMALVHDPEIVVLDEPEAGLDPQSRVRVREYILSLARKKTVILTTHNMDEAERLADRVAIIDHGELLVLDTPAVLKRHVGAGDVIEINFEREDARSVEPASQLESKAQEALAGLQQPINIRASQDGLILRALDAVSMLPAILQALEAAGLAPGEVRLRGNTLEDVFIQLTGRGLRE